MKSLAAIALFLVSAITGCTSTPSGAACPTTEARPTYETFGAPFMQSYCIGCHSKTATNRHGAPGDQDFDTEADIQAHAAEIDAEAAKGPNATNTAMPDMSGPVHARPSDDERVMLGQFLACEQH